jgi:phospholipid/cholesterol/gamma-HCH transport system permease protein
MAEQRSFRLSLFSGIVGRQALRLPRYLFALTLFTLRALREWREQSSLRNRATYSSLVSQIIFSGIDALPPIILLALASGVSLTSMLLKNVQIFGSTADIVNILSEVVALELGCLLTAIILVGRSGSAITIDLGNMKLNREIEGLELLGINVNHLFVTPRLLGAAISQLVLAIFFSSLSVVSAIAFNATLYSSSYWNYLGEIPLAFNPADLLLFVVKNLLFGLIIGVTACYHGLQVRHSVTEVPQQSQRAIVNSLSIIFLLDGLFAILFR